MKENNSGEGGNKKFILIGIGLILVLGIFWVVNNVDFNKVGEDMKEVWEDYIGGDEKEDTTTSNGFSNVTQIYDVEVFTPLITTIIALSFLMVVIGVLLPIVFPKNTGLIGANVYEEEEDDEEEEEEEDDEEEEEEEDDE